MGFLTGFTSPTFTLPKFSMPKINYEFKNPLKNRGYSMPDLSPEYREALGNIGVYAGGAAAGMGVYSAIKLGQHLRKQKQLRDKMRKKMAKKKNVVKKK